MENIIERLREIPWYAYVIIIGTVIGIVIALFWMKLEEKDGENNGEQKKEIKGFRRSKGEK